MWPIIAGLDRQIALIAPNYEVHQIKRSSEDPASIQARLEGSDR